MLKQVRTSRRAPSGRHKGHRVLDTDVREVHIRGVGCDRVTRTDTTRTHQQVGKKGKGKEKIKLLRQE